MCSRKAGSALCEHAGSVYGVHTAKMGVFMHICTRSREPLIELLFERLAADGVPTVVSETVLGAVSGDAELAEVLAGRPAQLPDEEHGGDEPQDHVYLSAVTVAGFRGIGPERTLTIRPEPWLTVVVGRNGSGKSSFAEAIELALTGDSARWSDRHSVWRTGWRNLHTPQPCAITTDLRVDGVTGTVRIHRSWKDGADLPGAETTVIEPGGRRAGLADLGLARALRLYRPFLTAADLGKLLSGTPSDLFDALDDILGLDALTAADKRLMAAAKPADTAVKECRATRTALVATLAAVDDDRARRAALALSARMPDLDVVEAILRAPGEAGPDETVAACRRLRDLALPDSAEMARLAGELRTAAASGRDHDDARGHAAARTAELLRLALDQHGDTGDGPCPVCGTGTLDSTWREAATTQVERLEASTRAAREVAERLTALTRQVRQAISAVRVPVIDSTVGATLPDLGLAALTEAVARLHAIPTDGALADHLATTYPAVTIAAADVHARAAAWLEQRDSAWLALAADLRGWLTAARAVPRHEAVVTQVKAARAWLKTTAEGMRNERLAPFAEHSQRIWQQLRQESNIELGRMSLVGANTRRRIALPVSVDGVDNGTALGVMSQGELHALGLATFLPRSCAKESPFRFIVIDDPVQSMDPSKVDGLARALGDLAAERQVIVFTHDNRLPDAVRNLELDADIIEVVRAEGSVVTLRPARDPVCRYLDDADAVARSANLPADVRAPIVAELCRSGLEAACHRSVWRQQIANGQRHTDIEAAIEATGRSVAQVFALALFDDADRGGDVLARLNRSYGRWAADAYQVCRKGVHGHQVNDLCLIVADSRRLAKALP
jgi:AAA domain/AAA domain, putative AbiEii toxin, Type IV TA system